MAEGTWVASSASRDADRIRAGRTDDSELGTAGPCTSLFGRTLVPSADGLSLGVAQLRWHAGYDQLGRRDVGDVFHARGFRRPIARRRWWLATSIHPCLHKSFWGRKRACDCCSDRPVPYYLRGLQSCRCTASGARRVILGEIARDGGTGESSCGRGCGPARRTSPVKCPFCAHVDDKVIDSREGRT